MSKWPVPWNIKQQKQRVLKVEGEKLWREFPALLTQKLAMKEFIMDFEFGSTTRLSPVTFSDRQF